VRFIADPLIVDPLGSCAMGANVFPVTFLGLFAIRPAVLKEWEACIPIPPIPPFASAYVLGRASVMASAIVVSFMIVSFVG
jgi:hypothetical protein